MRCSEGGAAWEMVKARNNSNLQVMNVESRNSDHLEELDRAGSSSLSCPDEDQGNVESTSESTNSRGEFGFVIEIYKAMITEKGAEE